MKPLRVRLPSGEDTYYLVDDSVVVNPDFVMDPDGSIRAIPDNGGFIGAIRGFFRAAPPEDENFITLRWDGMQYKVPRKQQTEHDVPANCTLDEVDKKRKYDL